MNILIFIVILITIYIIWNKFKYNPDKHELSLPGPKPLPIIGNLHQAGGDLPINVFTKLSLRYNHIYRIWLGEMYTVIVSDPKLLREMFIDKFENFKNRPLTAKIQFGNNYHGTSMGCGEYWDNNRDVVSRALRKSNNKEIYEYVNVRVMDFLNMLDDKFLDSDDYSGNKERFIILNKPRFYYQRYAISIMYKFIFNEDISYSDDEKNVSELKEILIKIKDIFTIFSNVHVIDFIKVLQPIYFKYLTYKNKTFPSYFKYIHGKYQEHLKQMDFNSSGGNSSNSKPKDLLEVLINEYGKDNPNSSEVQSILTSCLDFFLAGTDTTASTLEWITLKLINLPDVQERIYNELKSLNKSQLKAQDKTETPLLNSFIKETTRLFPGVPFGLPHVSEQDIIIADKYFIPKGAEILINFRAIAYNDEYFNDAKSFIPERFINCSKKENDAYIPFAIGPRNCPGQLLSSEEIYCLVSNLILNYRFESIDGKPIPEIEKLSLTLNPKGFKKIKIIKRK